MCYVLKYSIGIANRMSTASTEFRTDNNYFAPLVSTYYNHHHNILFIIQVRGKVSIHWSSVSTGRQCDLVRHLIDYIELNGHVVLK